MAAMRLRPDLDDRDDGGGYEWEEWPAEATWRPWTHIVFGDLGKCLERLV
jgi:hypothetical protein